MKTNDLGFQNAPTGYLAAAGWLAGFPVAAGRLLLLLMAAAAAAATGCCCSLM